MTQTTQVVPVLPLRDVVVYPHMVIPLFVGREKSVKALDMAMESNKQILLVAQKSAGEDNPDVADIYNVGTLSSILQLLKLPDGTIKVLVEGNQRANVMRYASTDATFTAEVQVVPSQDIGEREAEVLMRSVMSQFDQYVKLNRKIPPEIISSLSSIDEPSRLADTIAAQIGRAHV